MESYEELLEQAKSKLPEVKATKERFEIPQVTGHIQGAKTVINNFQQICQTLRRPPEQLLKYLQRELATPAEIEGPRLVLGRKISSNIINNKIVQYCRDFVICRECHKPDTQIFKEDRIMFLKCTACGAKQPIKAKIS